MKPTEPDAIWRNRARQALERYFQKRSAPRLILSLLLVLTGAAGFAVSFVSLHLDLRQMWLRYPIAVLAGYGVFLLLLRLWVGFEEFRFDPQPNEIEATMGESTVEIPQPARRYRSSSWLDWLDVPGLDHEGCAPVILIAVILALVGLLLFAIASASALISEVFLDAFLVTVLYRRLRVAAREHWLGTPVRKTLLPVLLTATLLSLAGWCLETMAPGADSIRAGARSIAGRPRAKSAAALTNQASPPTVCFRRSRRRTGPVAQLVRACA
jgi:hypothetical protein